MKIKEDIILIAGPTASGKTGLAIDLARANDGLIINADSMQVYADLRVLTARPSSEEEAFAPHLLFGHKDGATAYSVAHWIEDVRPFLERSKTEKRKLVIVGGTGLYFNSLLQGLSPMPEIDPDVRTKWRNEDQVTQRLHDRLGELDPEAAAVLNPMDRQRVMRALEIFETTGKSILEWQEGEGAPVLPEGAEIKRILLMPERSVLHERINKRFDLMLDEGALQEVNALLERELDPALPVMKAIGVPQLAAYLRGELSLEDAAERAKAASRQYAKRQSTWFRNSFDENWKIF
ncbi:MAG: tRNA (adenosine(37)-N6)-dimethylallyltransferase MiaA [Rhizobiaceae bacterium]